MAFVQYTWSRSGSAYSGRAIIQEVRQEGWDLTLACHANLLEEEGGFKWTVMRHGKWLAGGGALRRGRRWGRDLLSIFSFVNLFRGKRVSVVYINNLTGFSAAAAARIMGIPVIWHIREQFSDVGGEMHDPLGGRGVVRWVLRHFADHLVVISESVRRNVLGNGDWPQVSLIPNAVGADFFDDPRTREEARRELGLPIQGPIVGVPGTLRPVKGHPFFLESAARVARDFPDCLFAISGDGEGSYPWKLQEQIRALGLEDRVRFTGSLADMRLFYRACNLVVVPSRAESFGRTAIEAFAMGTPVIATRVGGMAETIEHEWTGLLVEYGDIEGLAGAMRRLMAHPEEGKRLAAAALAEAGEKYHEKIYQKRVMGVIDEVLKRRGLAGLREADPLAKDAH